MAEAGQDIEASWEELRVALERYEPDMRAAVLTEFAKLARNCAELWVDVPRGTQPYSAAGLPMLWDHVSSRQEFLLWGQNHLHQLEEHQAEVKASAEWKPEWEHIWANTDLWSYLEAMFAIVEARRYDQIDWRTLAEIMDSATTYE